MQDNSNLQDTQDPKFNVAASKPTNDDVNGTLGANQPVPADDLNIEPDETLQGYQDDLGTGDKTDIVQEEQGDQATDFLGIPESELKNEFDKMEPTEQANPATEQNEDWREHVEDMDENDKDTSSDSQWIK